MSNSQVKLKYIAQLISGGTPEVSDETNWAQGEEGFSWVSIGDMSNRSKVSETSRRVSSKGIFSARLAVAPPGTLLMSMYASLGHTAFTTKPSAWNQAILAIIPQGEFDARFVNYSLMAQKVNLEALARSSTQSNLNAEQIGNLRISNLLIEEQRRIAEFLDAEVARVDQILLARRRQLELLSLRRERVIEQALGLGVSCQSGKMVPLKYLVRRVSVGIVVTPASWYVEVGGVPALRGVNIRPGKILRNDMVNISNEGNAFHQKSQLSAGDLVVVRTGQAGAAAVVPDDLDGVNCIDLVIIKPGNFIDSKYIEYILNSSYAKGRIDEYSVGSIQSHFNVSAMKDMPIPVLDLERQKKVTEGLDQRVGVIDELQEQINQQVARLEERKRALITAAVTGQIDVTTARGADLS